MTTYPKHVGFTYQSFDPNNVRHMEALFNRLSNISRWHGAVRRPYSVLQHSLIMALSEFQLTKRAGWAQSMLLHDADEGVLIGDVPPLQKRDFLAGNAAYVEAITEVKYAIQRRWNPDSASHRFIKKRDLVMMSLEHEFIFVEDRTDEVIEAAHQARRNEPRWADVAQHHMSLMTSREMIFDQALRHLHDWSKLQ